MANVKAVRKACLSFQEALEGQNLHYSEDSTVFEDVLCLDSAELLVGATPIVDALGADFVFLIPWNERTNSWNRSIPFLVRRGSQDPILAYLVLQRLLGISGTTEMVFDARPEFSGIVRYTLGNLPGIREVVRGSTLFVEIVLPVTWSTSEWLNASKYLITKIRDLCRSTFGGCDGLRIDSHVYATTGSKGKRLDVISMEHIETSEEVRQSVEWADALLRKGLEKADREELRFLNDVEWLLRGRTEGEPTLDILKTFWLVHALMTLWNDSANLQLVYAFNSCYVLDAELRTRGIFVGRGSLVTRMPRAESNAEKWNEPVARLLFEVNASVASRFGLTQKVFQQIAVKQHAAHAAVAAIMSRNMSHNIGSHALAGVSKGDIKTRPGDVDVMLRYLQERMDFVARVATEWPSWRQPQLFFRDLVMGWAQQGLLLDKLVYDDRYPGQQIKVKVKLLGSALEIELSYGDQPGDSTGHPRKGLWPNQQPSEDVMVAIPGGRVGRQAFYGFLENAVRNAAKHNSGAENDKLVVQLELEDKGSTPAGHPAYLLKYRDNLSPDGELCTTIQEKLRTPLVDPATGEMTPQDWGIQEMKVYADYLAHRFTSGDGELSIHEENGERYRLWCDEGDNPENSADGKVLEYQLLLQKPTLALVYTSKNTKNWPSDGERLGLVPNRFDAGDFPSFMNKLVQEVAERSPSLLYLECPEASLGEFLKLIKDNELFLPARILIRVVDGKGEDDRRKIETLDLVRRVYLDEEDGSPLDVGSNSEELLLELYRRWLLAFGKEHGAFTNNDPLNVVVYFARAGEAGKKPAGRWVNLGDRLYEPIKKLVNVFPLYKSERSSKTRVTIKPWSMSDKLESDTVTVGGTAGKGPWLLFDGHGQARGLLRNTIGDKLLFYHYIGRYSDTETTMPNNREAFDIMANPSTGLAGALFLVSVVEAALTRVLVIDERIAGRLFAVGSQGLDEKQHELQVELHDARIDVMAGFKIDGSFRPVLDVKKQLDSTPDIPCRWLEMSQNGELKVGSVKKYNDGKVEEIWQNQTGTSPAPPYYDAAVIHRGIVEGLEEGSDLSGDAILSALRRVAARTVVTSGRGVQVEGPLGRYPFVEFAAVDASVGREFSKVSLGAVLGAVIGRHPDDER